MKELWGVEDLPAPQPRRSGRCPRKKAKSHQNSSRGPFEAPGSAVAMAMIVAQFLSTRRFRLGVHVQSNDCRSEEVAAIEIARPGGDATENFFRRV